MMDDAAWYAYFTYNYVVDPAHAAWAASLVARFAEAIQATKELQALQALQMQNRSQLLEKLVLKRLNGGDATFLQQRRILAMMPPRLKEKINRKCSKWRFYRYALMLMDPRIRHLYLHFDGPFSQAERDLFCETAARECKTSLHSLEIRNHYQLQGEHWRQRALQASSLLKRLRALTSLHLVGTFTTTEIDHHVKILAATNPDIRNLRLPNLSKKSLCKIAERWPELESLQADRRKFDTSDLKTVLPGLKNLQKLKTRGRNLLSKVMLKLARAHDPASPPYKLAEGFDCCFSSRPVSSGDMVKVFTAFPALYWLTLRETDVPAVCAGLEGREHIHITELLVKPNSPDPRALEPLLARVGPHLTKLEVLMYYRTTNLEDLNVNPDDLNMIGHYCPKLQDLTCAGGDIISSDEFEVTNTHFAKLNRCLLSETNNNKNNCPDLPKALVCSLLASPTLKRLDSNIAMAITEEVVATLAAKREQGALKSLQELSVWWGATSVEALAELASYAPCLRSLTFCICEKDDGHREMQKVLDSFMQQSGLKVSIHHALRAA